MRRLMKIRLLCMVFATLNPIFATTKEAVVAECLDATKVLLKHIDELEVIIGPCSIIKGLRQLGKKLEKHQKRLDDVEVIDRILDRDQKQTGLTTKLPVELKKLISGFSIEKNWDLYGFHRRTGRPFGP